MHEAEWAALIGCERARGAASLLAAERTAELRAQIFDARLNPLRGAALAERLADVVRDGCRCYERAAAHDDAEGHATIKLARLHRSRNDHDKAVACFQAYVDLHGQGEEIVDATAEALLYLASKHKQKADYAAAQACLARLLDYGGPEKLEAQAMLRELRPLIDTTAAPPA